MDGNGELLFGDETRTGAKGLAEQVRLAELIQSTGYGESILTIDISKGSLTDHNHEDLTIDQLNGTIADLQRYEQTVINGTAPPH